MGRTSTPTAKTCSRVSGLRSCEELMKEPSSSSKTCSIWTRGGSSRSWGSRISNSGWSQETPRFRDFRCSTRAGRTSKLSSTTSISRQLKLKSAPSPSRMNSSIKKITASRLKCLRSRSFWVSVRPKTPLTEIGLTWRSLSVSLSKEMIRWPRKWRTLKELSNNLKKEDTTKWSRASSSLRKKSGA